MYCCVHDYSNSFVKYALLDKLTAGCGAVRRAADDFLRKRLCRDKVLAVIQSVLMEYKQKGAIYSYSHQFEGTRADTITNSIGDNEYAAAASAVALGQSHKVL